MIGIEDLKPCPFCGAELERIEIFTNRSQTTMGHPGDNDDRPCILSGTLIQISEREDDQERAALWNTRATEAAP